MWLTGIIRQVLSTVPKEDPVSKTQSKLYGTSDVGFEPAIFYAKENPYELQHSRDICLQSEP